VRGDNVVIQGVEYDRDGRRVAYWLFPVHPGEIGQLGVISKTNRFQSQRVDAAFVDHIYRIDRPGQVRGVPWLAPILVTLRDISDYEEAELVRKKIAACLSFFVKSTNGSTAGIAQVVRERAEDGKPQRVESAKPGRIHYLEPGQEVDSVDPAPSLGYADHLRTLLRKTAAGVGMMYTNLTGDLSSVNYSSLREDKLDFHDLLNGWQGNMLVPQHCRPAWRRVMQIGSLSGLKVDPSMRAIHTVPKRPWVDPKKDVEAKLLELVAGLETWPDFVAGNGDDPEDQIAEILQWRDRLAAAGVSFIAAKAPQPNAPEPGEPGGPTDAGTVAE
jgi:lambda family phage portal protein